MRKYSIEPLNPNFKALISLGNFKHVLSLSRVICPVTPTHFVEVREAALAHYSGIYASGNKRALQRSNDGRKGNL
jgi:hypothetical protein